MGLFPPGSSLGCSGDKRSRAGLQGGGYWHCPPGTDRNGNRDSQSNMQLCLSLNPTDGTGGTTEWAQSSTVTNHSFHCSTPGVPCHLPTQSCSAARNANCYQCHLPSSSLFSQSSSLLNRTPLQPQLVPPAQDAQGPCVAQGQLQGWGTHRRRGPLIPHTQRASLQAAAINPGARGSLKGEHSRAPEQGKRRSPVPPWQWPEGDPHPLWSSHGMQSPQVSRKEPDTTASKHASVLLSGGRVLCQQHQQPPSLTLQSRTQGNHRQPT